MKKVLCWSDSPNAGSGFGTVSKHVIKALYNTGEYLIHQLAINDHGDFDSDVPWEIRPAKLHDPADPQGREMFYHTLLNEDYDIVWMLNDLYVTHDIHAIMRNIKMRIKAKGRKPPVFIYYYPVDNKGLECYGALEESDIIVCYSDFGKEQTLLATPHLEHKLVQIPHGVDVNTFHPLEEHKINELKQKYFSVSSDTVVVTNINKNSRRKQIPYSMLAFKEFKQIVPNSLMYVHAIVNDPYGYDLLKVAGSLGLELGRDIIFPHPNTFPIPDKELNEIYNASDVFLTTHLGEGWGLTITEAMSAGVPVVAPNNTCMPEQLGKESERGYMYPCNDYTWMDNSGFRVKGNMPDIVNAMIAAYTGKRYTNPKVIAANNWARQHSWEEITKRWIDLFNKASAIQDAQEMYMTEEL